MESDTLICANPDYEPDYYSDGDPAYKGLWGWVQVPPSCPCQTCSEKWNNLAAKMVLGGHWI